MLIMHYAAKYFVYLKESIGMYSLSYIIINLGSSQHWVAKLCYHLVTKFIFDIEIRHYPLTLSTHQSTYLSINKNHFIDYYMQMNMAGYLVIQ